jgi:hypothetical protein
MIRYDTTLLRHMDGFSMWLHSFYFSFVSGVLFRKNNLLRFGGSVCVKFRLSFSFFLCLFFGSIIIPDDRPVLLLE